MKLAVPAVGIVVAAASCCCCGDLETKMDEIMGGGEPDAIYVEPDGTTVAPTPSAGAGTVVSGACGRFGSMGIEAPSGFSILACSDQGSNGSLLLQGSASPKDACSTMRAWATGGGWNVETEASMGDTVSLIFGKGGDKMTVACTNMTGATTIAVTLSNG